mmetsp:Transcript_45917/g.127523  ORF Transcript_45917/g.127523 Transcript_45917/m.127523 type:complete len:225 (-) Transcript_45917:252-926(-)
MGAARRQDRTRRRQGPALPARAAPAHRPLRPQAGQRAHLRRPRGQALGRGRRQALRQHAHARAEPHAALRVARAAQRCGRGPASGRLLVRRHDPRGVPRPATTAARAAAVCAQKGVGRHAAAQTDRRSIGYGGALPRAGATADGGGAGGEADAACRARQLKTESCCGSLGARSRATGVHLRGSTADRRRPWTNGATQTPIRISRALGRCKPERGDLCVHSFMGA